MQVKGRITEWNDLRGFGFVSPLEGGERVFFHVSAFLTGSRRPTEGEFVSYTLGADERGRLLATQVTYAVTHAKRSAVNPPPRNASLIAGCVAAAFLGVVTLLAIGGRLGWPTACVYIVACIAAYFAYKHDKEAAQVGARRTSEWTLITLGLIGGWPGALVARHGSGTKRARSLSGSGIGSASGSMWAWLAWLIAP